MLQNKIKLNFFSFILLMIAIIAPTLVIVNKIIINSESSITEMTVDTSKIISTKTFPETLDALINATGKKDYITIPMPTRYYKYRFEDMLGFEKINPKDIFDKATVSTTDDITLVTLNTNVKKSTIYVKDYDDKFYYKYTISNGYVLSTQLAISMPENRTPKEDGARLNFLKKTFEEYLMAKGFKKKFTFFNYDDIIEYISDSKIVQIKIVSFQNYGFTNSFEVTMLDKDTEENKEKINEIVFKREYKDLEKILK